MQAVEATIDAAEVALEELCSAPLQRPCGGRATEGRLPPGIAARAARLAEIAGGAQNSQHFHSHADTATKKHSPLLSKKKREPRRASAHIRIRGGAYKP